MTNITGYDPMHRSNRCTWTNGIHTRGEGQSLSSVLQPAHRLYTLSLLEMRQKQEFELGGN